MPPIVASSQETSVPLCVDLDGTLIKSDVLWESLILLLKRNPFYLFALPFWLLGGRAAMKKEIAARTELNAASLPYHLPFLEHLKAERRKGRTLVLATAADRRLAQNVAAHLGIFDDVIASNGHTNMRGKNKGDTLTERFGSKGFDYAGNSTVDLPVWQQARRAIVVNANESLARQARSRTEVGEVFHEPGSRAADLLQAMRPHQWVKNLIIFVPLITSHKFGDPALLAHTVLALIAFCLCASAVYVLNDLSDLEADRHHQTKNLRPFASGRLPLPFGFALVPLLLGLSALSAFWLSWDFAAVLALYVVLTTSYSWRVKQIALLDVFFLAGLYTMRLIAGHAATNIEYSFWLLAFSMFIFLSLALVKRFTELKSLRLQNRHDSKGRGYLAGDLELVAMLGIGNGFLAVLVMALYVNSDAVSKLYLYHEWLLLVCPMLLFWISRVWLIAHRGQMHDDPIVFALKDGVSYLIGALTLGVLWLATGHHHLPF
jgi:4-hydroxybenzoate polyprenyltransferase/phosphoserine phosphatase